MPTLHTKDMLPANNALAGIRFQDVHSNLCNENSNEKSASQATYQQDTIASISDPSCTCQYLATRILSEVANFQTWMISHVLCVCTCISSRTMKRSLMLIKSASRLDTLQRLLTLIKSQVCISIQWIHTFHVCCTISNETPTHLSSLHHDSIPCSGHWHWSSLKSASRFDRYTLQVCCTMSDLISTQFFILHHDWVPTLSSNLLHDWIPTHFSSLLRDLLPVHFWQDNLATFFLQYVEASLTRRQDW